MNSNRGRSIAAAATAYAMSALAWTFLSDQFLSIPGEVESIVRVSSATVVFLVLATTGLLVLAMQAVTPADVEAAVGPIRATARPRAATVPIPAAGSVTEAGQRPPALAIDDGAATWGSAAAHRRYLRLFVAENTGIVDRVRATGSPAEAAELIHKLRGASACLALPALAAHAGRVERRLREGDRVDDAIGDLQSTLAETLAAIDAYAGSPAEPHDAVSPSADRPSGAQSLCELLASTLQAFDSDDPATVEPLLDQLALRLPAARLQPLRRAVERFEFDAGGDAVRALAASLGIEQLA